MNKMLLVIDMQNGFMSAECRHIIPVVIKLIEYFSLHNQNVAFTRFINRPTNGYVKWIKWAKLMNEPEINIITELRAYTKKVFDKNYYSAFTDEFMSFVVSANIEKIYLCGLDTDSCVLKSAIDAFEKDIEPIVVKDACYSSGGEKIHHAGLFILSRNIGKHQILESQNIFSDDRF